MKKTSIFITGKEFLTTEQLDIVSELFDVQEKSDTHLLMTRPLEEEWDFKYWLTRSMKRDNVLMVSYHHYFNNECLSHYEDDYADGFSSLGIYLVKGEGLKQSRFETNPDYWLPISTKGSNQVLFLDRDGIINEDKGYIYRKEDFIFVEGIELILKWAKDNNRKIVVLTNQSGVGRNYYQEEDVLILHDYIDRLLEEMGLYIDAWYFSPYHPEGEGLYKKLSHTRKPAPGMALLANLDLKLDLSNALMIGDKPSDCLNLLDIPTYFLRGNYSLTEKFERKGFSHHQELLNFLEKNYSNNSI